MPGDNVFNLITSEYYQLTSREKNLASFIMANGQQAQKMSISELSEACSIACSTISRFCRKMGYEGYSEFRLALASATATRPGYNASLSGEIASEDTVKTIADKLAVAEVDAINETKALIRPHDLQKAADLLQRSEKVLCMGQGASMLMAEEAAHLFTTVFPGFFPVSDSHMQIIAASNLTERDAVLYFSYSGSTKDLQDILRLAHSRKAKVLLITRFPRSPGAEKADQVLQCGYAESPLQLGSMTARIAQLYLVDVLFSEMCRRDLERCRQKREQVAEALSDKHI